MYQQMQAWPIYAQCEVCAVTAEEEMQRATQALMALLQPEETVLAAASALTKGRRSLVACTNARLLSIDAQDDAHALLFAMEVERIARAMSTIWYGSGNVTAFFAGGQQDFCSMSSHACTPMCRVIDAQREARLFAQGGATAEDETARQGAVDGTDGAAVQRWPVYARCEVCAVTAQDERATQALMALLQPEETVLAAVSAMLEGTRALLACTDTRILCLGSGEAEAGRVRFALPMARVKRALNTIWYGSGNVAVYYEGGQAHFCGMPAHACLPVCRVIEAQSQSAQTRNTH